MRKVSWSRSIVVFLLLLSGIGGGLAQPSYQNLAVLAGFDGSRPLGSLIRGQDGFFYGTTSRGGDFDKGTLFRVGPDGSGFESLHHFAGEPSDGDSPRYGTLAGDGAGGYYGTTFSGGTADAGTLFRLDLSGLTPNLQILFSFPATSAHPHGGVSLPVTECISTARRGRLRATAPSRSTARYSPSAPTAADSTSSTASREPTV